MFRIVLATLALGALTACSSAVGSAPGLDLAADAGPAPAPSTSVIGSTTIDGGSVDADRAGNDDGNDDGTTAPDDIETTAPSSTDVEEPLDTEPAPDPRPAIAPLDPPLAAVWQEDGTETRRAQERLLSLGFWLAEANGEYGQTTTQAVMAFQKYHGLTADGKLGPETASVMSTTTVRPTGRSTGGTLVEVDKSKQLVFVVRDGVTDWVLNTSTGSEVPYREPDQNSPGEFIEDDSVTRTGVFAVDRERSEGWWEGDLGEIYRPKYFDGGIALHGSYNIPPYPASHGCVRLSIQAMDWIWAEDVVPMGTTVWVHGEIPPRDA